MRDVNRRQTLKVLLAGAVALSGIINAPLALAQAGVTQQIKTYEDVKPPICKGDVERKAAKDIEAILKAVGKDLRRDVRPDAAKALKDEYVRGTMKLVGQYYKFTD